MMAAPAASTAPASGRAPVIACDAPRTATRISHDCNLSRRLENESAKGVAPCRRSRYWRPQRKGGVPARRDKSDAADTNVFWTEHRIPATVLASHDANVALARPTNRQNRTRIDRSRWRSPPNRRPPCVTVYVIIIVSSRRRTQPRASQGDSTASPRRFTSDRRN